MPRDTQRQRLYNAEAATRGDFPSKIGSGSMDEVTAWVAEVVGSAWWQRRSLVRSVRVKDGRGRRSAAAWSDTITVPAGWARSRSVVLHELAHVVTPNDVAPHGAVYAANLLALVRQFGEEGQHAALKAAFARYRVKARGSTLKPIHERPTYTCDGCGKTSSRPMPWRPRLGVISTRKPGSNALRFHSKTCAESWWRAGLQPNERAAARRG